MSRGPSKWEGIILDALEKVPAFYLHRSTANAAHAQSGSRAMAATMLAEVDLRLALLRAGRLVT